MSNQTEYWALTDISGSDGATGAGGEVVLTVGEVEIPIASLTMSYGMNAIPRATALVALGRDARTGQPSPIYSVSSQLKQMTPVKITIRGDLGEWATRGAAGAKIPWPAADEHIIFVGYVLGTSYRRSLGRVMLVLNMINTLVELTMSSSGSRDLLPGAPHDLMLPTLIQGAGGKGLGTADSQFIDQLPTQLPDDFSDAILYSLLTVARENQIQTSDAGGPSPWCNGAAPPGPINKRDSNEKVINTIKGSGDWLGIANSTSTPDKVNPATNVTSPYTEAYPFNIHTTGYQNVARFIGGVFASSFAGTSMWDMMIGALLPSFGVSIIPTAQQAYLVPVVPMLREAQKTITASDYVDLDFSAAAQQPIYGVGVMANYNTATMYQGANDNKRCIGATFVAKADDGTDLNDGAWLFVNAPRWMDDWVNVDTSAGSGAGGDGGGGKGSKVVRLLSEPSHDAVGGEPGDVGSGEGDKAPDDEAVEWNNVMEKYARLVYIANALRNRKGRVTGKLRFDISPGSTIQIQARDPLQSNGVDELVEDLVGLVAQVTININAEQASASTTFELTNIRTVDENTRDRFSLAEHPFFEDKFFKTAPIVASLDPAAAAGP